MGELWEIWYPDAASTGLLFCRARIDAAAAGDRLLVHAAPPTFDVIVRDATPGGGVVAHGEGLDREPGPMCWLVRDGSAITVVSGWPSDDDLGRIVLLPGGEAGTLTAWWHADDQSEWRWSVEFYNHT